MRQRFKKRFLFYGAMVLLLWTANVFSEEREDRNYDKQKLVRELIVPGYVFKLKLSKEQEEKFVPIFEEYDQKRDDLKRKVREHFTENRKENMKNMKKEVKALRDETEVKLKGILTRGQLKEFRKLDQKLEQQGGKGEKGEKTHGEKGGRRGSKRKGSEKGLNILLTHL
jgi:hypothetical protein